MPVLVLKMYFYAFYGVAEGALWRWFNQSKAPCHAVGVALAPQVQL